MLTPETVKEYVENNPHLVRCSESTRYPGLYVLKYKDRVFYDNLWNEFLEEMRGTVVDKDFNPVVMPFRKIYNRGENGKDFDRDEQVTAVRKINGFMAACTYVPSLGHCVVSTTGSLDSDYVRMAEENIPQSFYDFWKEPVTFLFEIVDERDPHVIPEKLGVYFIGYRHVEWNGFEYKDSAYQKNLDIFAEDLSGIIRPEWFTMRWSDLIKLTQDVKHEGFVAHNVNNNSLKLKSPYYKTTKLFGRMSPNKLSQKLKDVRGLKQQLPEEYYNLVDHLKENQQHFLELGEQEKFQYIRNYIENMETE